MNRRHFLAAAIAAALPPGLAAAASHRPARIGFISAQRADSLTYYVDAMRDGLAELGYAVGRNIEIAFRYGEDSSERVPALAAELVRLPVDLIVAQGAAAGQLRKAGVAVPVLFVFSADPISAGYADSLSRPRGNMTGLTLMAAELNGKRLELAREILPGLKRVALVGNPGHPGEHLERAACDEAGRSLGFTVDYFPTRTRDELAAAIERMAAAPPQAITVLSDAFAVGNRDMIIRFAQERRLPVIAGWPVFAESGALLSFGPHLGEVYRRLAYFIDRMLKGAKVADLPIEQPTRYELVLNLRAARTLGLAIPPAVLAAADQVIE